MQPVTHPLIAIVIPAYKADFLASTLQSITQQLEKNFRVYVGDDASPANLLAICEPFRVQLDLHYVRFDQNLGQQDLVAHWNRCVHLSEERWVWLFSDDDVMEPGCTEQLQQAIQTDAGTFDLYHFNVTKINEVGAVLEQFQAFPAQLSGRAFAAARLQSKLQSFAPDYVFSRAAFDRVKGFVNFPLAWCSDDASWIAMAGDKGICTLDGPRVRWRLSGQNITAQATSSGARKLRAATLYLAWLNAYMAAHPACAGDAADTQIQSSMPTWLFKQIRYTRAPFGLRDAFGLGWQLRRLPPGYIGWLWRAITLSMKNYFSK